MQKIQGRLSYFANPKASPKKSYAKECQQILSLASAEKALVDITNWPGYAVTPLHSLTQLGEAIEVKKLWYKDESQRFGLKSFKALGGAYAVAKQLQTIILERHGKEPTIAELIAGKWRKEAAGIVVSCATDGNHGRAVAWGAEMFGCGCVIYLHKLVSKGREEALKSHGAEVIRIEGNYDDSVRLADEQSQIHNRVIVSDTSYPGYNKIPKDIALGYTVMLAEIVKQLEGEIPTHVFIQAGVGGLALTVCGYFWELWGEKRPRFVVVEPEKANCLQESAKAGKPVEVEGDLATLMAGLSCGRVSDLAWPILKEGGDDFMTVSEPTVAQTMQLLALEYQIEAGESAVAGLAAAVLSRHDKDLASKLGLDQNSQILVIGTEGATDPELYHELVADKKIESA